MTFKDDKELKSMDEKALHKEISTAMKYFDGICFEHAQGNLKDTTQKKKTRRYIALIKTFMSLRNNEAPKEAKAA
jgi:ribosomal protein L29